jgi:ATP-dependent Clp protease adaptor protein ClpS
MKENGMNYIYMSEKNSTEGSPGIAIKERDKVAKPPMYRVLLHNDDYTTMEFVVHILQKFFKKNVMEAQAIMLKVHHEGVGVCGIYTFEVAESKAHKVNRYARSKGHPLKCSYEPCDSED